MMTGWDVSDTVDERQRFNLGRNGYGHIGSQQHPFQFEKGCRQQSATDHYVLKIITPLPSSGAVMLYVSLRIKATVSD